MGISWGGEVGTKARWKDLDGVVCWGGCGCGCGAKGGEFNWWGGWGRRAKLPSCSSAAEERRFRMLALVISGEAEGVDAARAARAPADTEAAEFGQGSGLGFSRGRPKLKG